MGFASEESNGCLECPKALVVHLMYGHYLPTSNHLIQNQTFAMWQGHQDGKHLAVRVSCFFFFFLQKQNSCHLHVPQFFPILLLLLLHECQPGSFPELGSNPFNVNLNFDDCNFRWKENKVRRSLTFLSISNWGLRG